MVRMRALLERVEPSQDPYLARLDALERRAVYAGYYIHLAAVARANDEDEAAAQATARRRVSERLASRRRPTQAFAMRTAAYELRRARRSQGIGCQAFVLRYCA